MEEAQALAVVVGKRLALGGLVRRFPLGLALGGALARRYPLGLAQGPVQGLVQGLRLALLQQEPAQALGRLRKWVRGQARGQVREPKAWARTPSSPLPWARAWARVPAPVLEQPASQHSHPSPFGQPAGRPAPRRLAAAAEAVVKCRGATRPRML